VNALFADSSSNFLTVDSVAKSANRVQKIAQPALTAQQTAVAQGEAALMMLLMRDTYVSLSTSQQDLSKLRAPKDRTKVWLLEEKFPTAQGWKPAEQIVTVADLGPINTAIVSSQARQVDSA
jgi:hypothetical protein